MEWLFIFGLVAAVVALLGRLKTAERRIEQLEAGQAFLLDEARGLVGAAARQDAPAQPEADIRASIPKAVAAREDEEAILSSPGETREEPARHEKLARAPFRLDIEDIFGRRLPIWAGGVTLAVAGVFLVRYSIERGLITPLLRVIMAFLFGFGLLAGAEAAHRFRDRIADVRVEQALAGAGLATLYAAFYLAGRQYGLIGQTLAFLGLAAVTAGAIALSFRFGLPSAVLGLVGGFTAPALLGGEEANLPLLALYLALVTAGLVLSGRRQQRPWMGMTALIGGLGWGALLLLSGDFGLAEVIALGLYFILLGAVLPALAQARRFERPLRIAAALVASLQLALLVDQAGYSPLVWGLYLLLGATLAFFAWRRPDIREGNAIGAAMALILLAQWDGAPGVFFTAVAAGIAAVFALTPLALVRRGEDRDVDRWQIAGTALGLAAVSYGSFGHAAADRVEALLALATATLAAIPGAAAWVTGRREDARAFALQLSASAALVFAALLMVSPGWAAPLAAAAVFAGLFALLRGRGEAPLHALLWGAAVVTGLALAAHIRFEQEVGHLAGWDGEAGGLLGFARWLVLAAVLASLSWRERASDLRRLAEGGAALVLYGALAQVLPREALAWTAALLAIGLHFRLRERRSAALAALAIAAAWALEPLGWWLAAGLASIGGDPVLASELPGLQPLATRLLPAIAALAIVPVPLPPRVMGRIPPTALALPLGLVVAHILFKQIFAIDSEARFDRFGLAERTFWEAILLAAAGLAAKGLGKLAPRRGIAIALAGAALAHCALYTALLHSPLFETQPIASIPLAMLLTALSYGAGIGAAMLLRHWSPQRLAPAMAGVVMGLACLAALTLLRVAFGGSETALDTTSQAEDLLRSLAGILLALFFLWVGSRTGERSWRLGSLAIMLVAVAKVFLVDAAGLDGLLRVASFMALGFSLIGIGWVYSRQLRSRPQV